MDLSCDTVGDELGKGLAQKSAGARNVCWKQYASCCCLVSFQEIGSQFQ